MTRIDYLMQDKQRVLDFMEILVMNDRDCQMCPFCKDGIIMGCATSSDGDFVDCSIGDYGSVEDFLTEEMPSEETMKMWKEEE